MSSLRLKLLKLAKIVGMAAVFVLLIETLRGVAGDRIAYYVGVFVLQVVFFYVLYR